jgi:hypothetical protein
MYPPVLEDDPVFRGGTFGFNVRKEGGPGTYYLDSTRRKPGKFKESPCL